MSGLNLEPNLIYPLDYRLFLFVTSLPLPPLPPSLLRVSKQVNLSPFSLFFLSLFVSLLKPFPLSTNSLYCSIQFFSHPFLPFWYFSYIYKLPFPPVPFFFSSSSPFLTFLLNTYTPFPPVPFISHPFLPSSDFHKLPFSPLSPPLFFLSPFFSCIQYS